MNTSLRLSVPDLSDAAVAAAFHKIADAATAADGYEPFNEQATLDLAAGRRTPVLATLADDAVGAALIGTGEFDLVVHPEHRAHGHGRAILDWMLRERIPPTASVVVWSHGDHPAARALAASHGFVAVRTLLQLRLEPLPQAATAPEISTFRPGVDEREWVELNAAIFARHPEQGRITVDDLRAREAEEWFDAADFLILRNEHGTMIGYNWLKVEGADGEIYVIGVDPASAGHGLGRALLLAGLARMRDRGVAAATLYVESGNTAAVGLYRSLGFTDHTVDVQYRRLTS